MHTHLDCLHSYFSIPDTANPPFYYFLKKYLRYSLESISNGIGADTIYGIILIKRLCNLVSLLELSFERLQFLIAAYVRH